MTHVRSFPPIVGVRPRILILGTMPGKMSLAAHEYYAHRQNAFWKILADVLAFDRDATYAMRVRALEDAQIALWDCLASCARSSSLDADIEKDTIVVNDVLGLLTRHGSIERVLFNGAAAEKLFDDHIASSVTTDRRLDRRRMPSTSPAHATMRYAEKLRAWRAALVIGA